MTYPQREAFPSDKQTVLIVIGVISLFLIVFHFGFVGPELDKDNKMIAQWQKDDMVAKQDTIKEQEKLKTINCSDLKTAIGNNEFRYLSQQANNQYLGRCT